MKQAVVKKGKVIAEEVSAPQIEKGCVLIKVAYSCISAGTEQSNVNESGKSLIKRALEQPDQVKKAWEIAKNAGFKKTFDRITGQLAGGKPAGYSLAGEVLGVGEGVKLFEIGDLVAAAGAGNANHAEFVIVPANLVMRIPRGLDIKKASTVTMGGIALQGVRRCRLQLGETAVVIGAGILGLLAQQMLQASGVDTLMIDLDDERLALAKSLGAKCVLNPKESNVVEKVRQMTGGYGADAVLFCAATSSSDPLSDAFKMCKKKGRVVLVGVSGMEIKRSDIYQKELDFLISTSYGPGRYDTNYEGKGLDYPFAYVRWTENRNMEAYLKMLQEGKVIIEPLINNTYKIDQVEEAFESLNPEEGPKPLLTFLEYGGQYTPDALQVDHRSKKVDKEKIQVAVVGVGGFATSMHLPNLKELSSKYQIKAIVNRTGLKAKVAADNFGAAYSTTDINDVLKDDDIDLIMIMTRHDSHAELTLKSLKAGKHVFVEKPLACTEAELLAIEDFFKGESNPPSLTVGFNRRFSPCIKEVKKSIKSRINPLVIYYRMNAGYIPLEHWVHENGGRIVGEACHIIDLMTYLTESKIKSISYERLTPNNDYYSSSDNVSIVLKYEDGSICTVMYFANGSKSLTKEYMEVHFDNKSIIMEDYKTVNGMGVRCTNPNLSRANKGQKEELELLAEALNNGSELIDLSDIFSTTRATLMI